ncbi:MAG: hypothetical protein AB2L20_31625 [Mangrovibacterium sp.]
MKPLKTLVFNMKLKTGRSFSHPRLNRFAGQQRKLTVIGKTTDEVGLPLPGVAIAVKGTIRGTTTDASGEL